MIPSYAVYVVKDGKAVDAERGGFVVAADGARFADEYAESDASGAGFPDAFPPEEFSRRRALAMASVGDGVAILQGTTECPGESPLRQRNQFFYLTGVVEPRALLIIDGRARRLTLFLLPNTPRRASQIGPYLGVNSESADDVQRHTRDGGCPRRPQARPAAGGLSGPETISAWEADRSDVVGRLRS